MASLGTPAPNGYIRRMPLFRRLVTFLRPHWWRLVGNLACNVIGTALDGAAFVLLIPFLNTLLGADQVVPGGMGWLSRMLNALVEPFLVAGDKRASLLGVIGVMLVLVVIKNLFLWMGGQIGASLQERQSGAQAPLLYAISILFVFLCLAALYESWSVPFSVILVVPLGVLGALLFTSLRSEEHTSELQSH